MRQLTVRPLPFGWALSLPGAAEDIVYRTGGAAETAARCLAERLAAHGEAVKLVVRLKDGSLGGRYLFPPSRHAGDRPIGLRAA